MRTALWGAPMSVATKAALAFQSIFPASDGKPHVRTVTATSPPPDVGADDGPCVVVLGAVVVGKFVGGIVGVALPTGRRAEAIMTTSGSILTRAPDGTPLRVADLTRAPIDDAAAARVSGRRRRLALWNAGARAVIICVAHSSWGFYPNHRVMNDN